MSASLDPDCPSRHALAEAIQPSGRRAPFVSLWRRAATLALALWLTLLTALAVAAGRHWPLVNDASLLHYISFLMDSGQAPYRQLLDVDLPGAFLVDWSVVHTLGPGATAWRLFDSLVCLGILLTMVAIAGPRARLAGLFGGTVFWLLHLRDGPGQAGQRDLVEALFLLAALASLTYAHRAGRLWPLLPAGLWAGAAATLKPDALLLAVLLFLLWQHSAQPAVPWPRPLALALLGLLLPLLATLIFLWREHALAAFGHTLTEVLPYYASLGRLSLPRLLQSWLPAPLRLLTVLALLVLATRSRAFPFRASLHPTGRLPWESKALLTALLWGLFSFLLQGKGFPYQRYPSLAFLLLLLALLFLNAVHLPGWPGLLAAVSLAYIALFLAPASLLRARRAQWNEDLLNALGGDLNRLGGPTLDHHVQCLDNIVGCNTVLLRLRLHQQTGMLTDFLVFGPASVPAVHRARQTFWRELTADPPSVLVVTGALHPGGPGDRPFAKLQTWPAFTRLLSACYTLTAERSFAPGLNGPLAYRLYTRLPQPRLPNPAQP